MKVIFTDFKRFNETHFWSSSRRNWLHQVTKRARDPTAKPDLDLLREPYSGRDMQYIIEVQYITEDAIYYRGMQYLSLRTFNIQYNIRIFRIFIL